MIDINKPAEAENFISSIKDTIVKELSDRNLIGKHDSYADRVAHWWHSYRHGIASTTSKSLVNDIKNFRVTAGTSTLAVTLVTVVIAASFLFSKPGVAPPKTKSKKKVTKAQKINAQIQQTLDKVEEEYVPQMDEYIENYDTLSEEKREYNANYFQEMLLKELMNLDGLDVAENAVLRDNRRKVIKFIQKHQSRLDKFRKSKAN